MAQFTFFEDQTTDDTSDIYSIQDGGYRVIKATGTFDGATITIEADFGDDDFADIQAYQFAEEDIKDLVMLKVGMRIRATISSAGASTSVSLKML